MAYTALLDANVLHPMVLCDFLIRLSLAGMFRARWSSDILAEVRESVLRRRPDLTPVQLARRTEFMNIAVPDAEISGYHALSKSLGEFGDDAHVVAAAVMGRADVIVTRNLKDFPAASLLNLGLVAQSPDEFLVHQWNLREQTVLSVLQTQAKELKNPPRSVEDVLARLRESAPQMVALAMARLGDLTS